MTIKTSYAILDGKLILGTAPCMTCAFTSHVGQAVTYPSTPCDNCHGTRRRSGRRCRRCLGADGLPSGFVPDRSQPIPIGPCAQCGGSGEVPATRYAHIDLSEWDIPIQVIVTPRGPLGTPVLSIDSLYSLRDYGRAWESYREHGILALEAIGAQVRKQLGCVQACKVSEKDGTLAHRIAVYLAHEGYLVVAERSQPTENISRSIA